MNWDKIAFGAGFLISGEAKDDWQDLEKMIASNKMNAILSLGQTIEKNKGKDLWQVKEHKRNPGQTSDDYYNLKLFVFTPAELDEYVDKVRKGI